MKNITLRWLFFKDAQEAIVAIRKKVFQDGQGYGDFMLSSDLDEIGLHLAAYDGDNLVSLVSAFPQFNEHTTRWGIESKGLAIQIGRRVELEEYRGNRIAALLVGYLFCSIYELLSVDIYFITLVGIHIKLKPFYQRSYDFKEHGTVQTINGEVVVLHLENEEVVNSLYTKTRRYVNIINDLNYFEHPSLLQHLQKHAEEFEFLRPYFNTANNIYLQPLSLKDELPRLTTQARLMYSTQKLFLENFALQKKGQKFLDIGCGPGVLISMLQKNPKFTTYEFYGMDISPDLIMYGKIVNPAVNWSEGSIYDTGFPNDHFDFIHASFLFIHLLNPEGALQELYRILKPNGIIFIVDVNDSTFRGPQIVQKLIKKHSQYHEGNRNIMNTLPMIAMQCNLTLTLTEEIIVDNQGIEGSPELKENCLHLGKMLLWGLFAFIGQRKEVADLYQKAERYYHNHDEMMDITIQTQVYVK